MKRVTGCEYEAGNDIPILLMVDGVDRDNMNKSYPYERVIHAKWIEDSMPTWDYSIDDSVMSSIYECSNCHAMFDVSMQRCGQCGAYMENTEEDK